MALNPLSVIRSPSPRGLGEKIAAVSLPGPAGRYRGDQWALNRTPWVHPWMPGAAGGRFDAKLLQRKILEDAAIDAGLDPAVVAAMSLDELLVLPDVQAVLQGAVISSARLPLSAPPIDVQLGSQYTILQSGGIATNPFYISGAMTPGSTRQMSGTIPGPVFLKSLSITAGSASSAGWAGYIDAGVLGRLFNGGAVHGAETQWVNKTIECGFIIERPVNITMSVRDYGLGGTIDFMMSVDASYQNVVRG